MSYCIYNCNQDGQGGVGEEGMWVYIEDTVGERENKGVEWMGGRNDDLVWKRYICRILYKNVKGM